MARDPEALQREHFNRIASAYAAHKGDVCSQRYRWRFMSEPLLRGVDVRGAELVDGMCGNGENTGYLLHRGARVTGVDISPEVIRNFQETWPECEARCASILDTGLESGAYDCVVISGGLHHVHPNVSATIEEVHRLLKPGGHFCFVEPHKGSFPDWLRQRWYKRDHLFAENEEAIDLQALKTEFASRFDFLAEDYGGNVGYIFIEQSLVLRIPPSLKSLYTPALMWVESVIEKIQGRRTSCFVVARWRKKSET